MCLVDYWEHYLGFDLEQHWVMYLAAHFVKESNWGCRLYLERRKYLGPLMASWMGKKMDP